MTVLRTNGDSVYQTWVLTLRKWAADPMTSLSHLPVLDDQTFTPATYERWFAHFNSALQTVVDRWVASLERAWVVSHDRFELGRQLVELRAGLLRRVELVSHPSLPETVRSALVKQTREDVGRYQRELEEAVSALSVSGHTSRDEVDAMLAVLREHPFTAVLDYRARDDGRIRVGPLPEVATFDKAARRTSVRRIDPDLH